MNADDPLLHVQLTEFAENVRKACGADIGVVIVSGSDTVKIGMTGTVATFDVSQAIADGGDAHTFAKVISALVSGTNNILAQSSDLKIALVDQKDGSHFDPPETEQSHACDVDTENMTSTVVERSDIPKANMSEVEA